MSNLLSKTFKIAQNSLFKVKIYSMDNDDTKEQLEMSYMKLGNFLIINSSKIKRVDIILNEKD